MASLRVLAAVWFAAVPAARAAEPPCRLERITSGGDPVVTAVLDTTPAAARHAARNAILAAGAGLEIDREDLVQGTRDKIRTETMRLESGPERLRVKLRPESGGVLVSVETLNQKHPRKPPGKVWSASVLRHVTCLCLLFSPVHPKLEPRGRIPADGEPTAAAPPPGTRVRLLLREFIFSADARNGQAIVLEVAEDIRVNGVLAIAKGALARAKLTGVRTDRWLGRGDRIPVKLESVTAADGTVVPLEPSAISVTGGNSAALVVLFGVASSGSAVALPAGQEFAGIIAK